MQRRNLKLARKRPDGYFDIRVYHRKGSKRKTARYLLKCGCCDEKVEIYYDKTGLEINGVNGSIQNWREILLLLLGIQKAKPKNPAHRQRMQGVDSRGYAGSMMRPRKAGIP